MGRLPSEVVYERACEDIDPLSDFLGTKPYFMGDKLRSVDANVLWMLNHVTYCPLSFEATDRALGKKNLVDYCERDNPRFSRPEATGA